MNQPEEEAPKESLAGNYSRGYFIFLIIFLGLLSAFGPFVTDMYLPAFPSMLADFNTTEALVLLGITTSLLGLAFGQVFFGPLSDKYGRKPMLIVSLLLFLIATILIVYSPSIEPFLVCRLFQGLGAAGGIVLSRSIVTDAYSGRNLAKMLAIVAAVNGIAPVFAPVIGGFIPAWRDIFWVLFYLGVALLLMSLLFVESLDKDRRFRGSIFSTFVAYGKLVRLPRFVKYVLMFMFANGVLFAYIASSSFIIQSHYGLSKEAYSLWFAVNAVAIGAGTTLAVKFKQIKDAGLFGAISALTLSVCQLLNSWFIDNFYVYEIMMFVILLGVGLIFTCAIALAMNEGRHYTGAASAVLGALGFLFGGLVSSVVGIGNIIHTMAITMVVCALLASGLAIAIKRDKDEKWNEVL